MQDDNTVTTNGPGERLRSAREAQGFTPWDIANQLYLAEKVIIALEEDDYEAGPGPAFARGYLRSYARLLRLSPEEIIASFEALGIHKLPQEEVPKTLKPPHATIARHRDKIWFAIIGGSIFLIMALMISMFWLESRQDEMSGEVLDLTTAASPKVEAQSEEKEIEAVLSQDEQQVKAEIEKSEKVDSAEKIEKSERTERSERSTSSEQLSYLTVAGEEAS